MIVIQEELPRNYKASCAKNTSPRMDDSSAYSPKEVFINLRKLCNLVYTCIYVNACMYIL